MVGGRLRVLCGSEDGEMTRCPTVEFSAVVPQVTLDSTDCGRKIIRHQQDAGLHGQLARRLVPGSAGEGHAVHADDLDRNTVIRGMHEFTVADVHAHVGDARVEAHDIAGLECIAGD